VSPAVWDPRRRVRTVADLLEATGSEDLTDLTAWIESRLPDLGEPAIHIQDVGDGADVDVVLPSGLGVCIELGWPTTLKQVRDQVQDAADRFDHLLAAMELPDSSTFVTSEDLVDALAEFFGVTRDDVLSTIGGGWVPVSGAGLVGDAEVPVRWFGAGSPLVALVGIGEDYASVARPVETGGGLAGPPVLEGVLYASIELRDDATLAQLGDAVDDVLTRSRRDWKHCNGCRELGPWFVEHGSRHYCRGCTQRYLGIIAC
jgi:hypothetical protein